MGILSHGIYYRLRYQGSLSRSLSTRLISVDRSMFSRLITTTNRRMCWVSLEFRLLEGGKCSKRLFLSVISQDFGSTQPTDLIFTEPPLCFVLCLFQISSAILLVIPACRQIELSVPAGILRLFRGRITTRF